MQWNIEAVWAQAHMKIEIKTENTDTFYDHEHENVSGAINMFSVALMDFNLVCAWHCFDSYINTVDSTATLFFFLFRFVKCTLLKMTSLIFKRKKSHGTSNVQRMFNRLKFDRWKVTEISVILQLKWSLKMDHEIKTNLNVQSFFGWRALLTSFDAEK